MPFYMESSPFQLATALLFAFASGCFIYQKEHKKTFMLAALVIFYVALDERYMLHECFKLSSHLNLKNFLIYDIIVFILGALGAASALYASLKLSKKKLETLLYLVAFLLCVVVVYLDALYFGSEYIKLTLQIEEMSEMLLAIDLIFIALIRHISWKSFFFGISLCLYLLYPAQIVKIYVWPYCPEVSRIR